MEFSNKVKEPSIQTEEGPQIKIAQKKEVEEQVDILIK